MQSVSGGGGVRLVTSRQFFNLGSLCIRIIMTTIILIGLLRWLDIVFQGQYLPSLSVSNVAISKDLEKLTPQLYKIKMKICYDQGCNDIGVVIATK